MAKKIDKIAFDLNKMLTEGQRAVQDPVLAEKISETVIARMLSFISGGVSPIQGQGRFPEYKAARAVRRLRPNIRAARRVLRSATTRRDKRIQNAAKEKLAGFRRKEAIAKKGYPFSVQKKFPNKRLRPVNLELSGEFLRNIFRDIKSRARSTLIEIGFRGKYAKIEQGHREGANTQPKRPIIPTGSQVFNRTISLDIIRLVRQAIKKASKAG